MLNTEAPLPRITTSETWLLRATGLIPCVTQTLAKGPSQHVRGVAPAFAQRGYGATIVDVDGQEYLDYSMAVGPVSLGYSHPVINDAIRQQLEHGIVFSLPHHLEVEVAELLRDVIPNVERVRFSKTGADVVSAAVRLARAHTGKSTILCCGYHGWHDWYIGVTDRHAGIPQSVRDLTFTFAYNDIESVLSAIDDDTAAIVLEPTVVDSPEENFLQNLRRICDDRGIVLVFDEMWTGFRLALGGAQEYYGVRADLICFSKAIANGMPLAVLCGRADIMDRLENDVFWFTTFGGETLSLAAAQATIQFLQQHDVIGHLDVVGRRLSGSLQELSNDLGMPWLSVKGYPARTMITYDSNAVDPLIARSYLQQELLRYGILWNGFFTLSYSHTVTDIDRTVAAFMEILPQLAIHVQEGTLKTALEGEPVGPVFRRTGNFNMRPRTADMES